MKQDVATLVTGLRAQWMRVHLLETTISENAHFCIACFRIAAGPWLTLVKYSGTVQSKTQKQAILFTLCSLLQHGICFSVNQSVTPSRCPASLGQCQVVWFDSAVVRHLPNSVFPSQSNNQASVQSVSHKVLLLIISSFLYHLAVNHCYLSGRTEAVVLCLQFVTPLFCLYAQSYTSKPRNSANSAPALMLCKAL